MENNYCKVWIVAGEIMHEGSTVLRVFDREYKAVEFVTLCEEYDKQHPDDVYDDENHPAGYFYDRYDIAEMKVE